MKYRDIRNSIKTSDWECDYTLPDFVQKIENFIIGEGCEQPLQTKPLFQRDLIWKEEQEIAYIESLLSGEAKHAKVIYLNYPSWKMYSKTGYDDFVLVDGQQRFKAVKRFVNNEIKAFNTYFKDFEDYEFLKRDMLLKININDLQTYKEVLEWYLHINDGRTPHTVEEINKVKKMISEL